MLSHLPAAEQERLRIRWQKAAKAKGWKQGRLNLQVSEKQGGKPLRRPILRSLSRAR